MRRMRRSVLKGAAVVLASASSVLGVVGCEPGDDGASNPPPSSLLGTTATSTPAASTPDSRTPSTSSPSTEGGRLVEVDSLGLSFTVADSYDDVDDPTFTYLARSSSPRSILSIDTETPSVIGHPARPGETLTDVTINGRSAVIATNSPVPDLPPGVQANELLVANGSTSFSLIMSAGGADLPGLWQPLIDSVQLGP